MKVYSVDFYCLNMSEDGLNNPMAIEYRQINDPDPKLAYDIAKNIMSYSPFIPYSFTIRSFIIHQGDTDGYFCEQLDGTYYIDGLVYTAEELKSMPYFHPFITTIMRRKNWEKIVLTLWPMNYPHRFKKGDFVITDKELQDYDGNIVRTF